MKKLAFILSAIIIFSAQSFAQPKYVFYFIGDGMGVNVVQLTEMYLASMEGELGVKPLSFSQFPVVSFGTTYSANSNVTDSAASGTALATGTKTHDRYIGVDPDGGRLTSIAERAAKAGKKVGITTSVGLNHATPAAFYAHQPDRKLFYRISMDMLETGFDFYAGAFLEKRNRLEDGTKVRDIREVIPEYGFTLVNGVEGFKEHMDSADKIVMLPAKGKGMTYGIDRKALGGERLTLAEITESAISFLQKGRSKGFFLMVEGGDIDGAEHGHDAATAIHEVLDFDDAVQVAIEFYKKHPKETLIVVTADHETGGLALDPDTPADLALLSNQKMSQERTSSIFSKMIKEREPDVLSWEETKDFLSEYFGLWTKVPVSWEQEKWIHDAYEFTVAKKDPGHAIDLYADNAIVIARAVQTLAENARVHWATSHTAGMVPTYALGVGAEQFSAKMDNTLIPQIIARVAKY